MTFINDGFHYLKLQPIFAIIDLIQVQDPIVSVILHFFNKDMQIH